MIEALIAPLITPRSYRCASLLAGPVVDTWLARRRRRGKEDRARFGERLGRPGLPRPEGRLVWMHGASVGESVSLLPLVARLRDTLPGLGVLVTTGTVTSARLLRERLPPGALHQFAPVDRPGAVRRFARHWRPDLAVWVESELWPNLVLETAGRGTPMLLVNARMSGRSAARWRRAPHLSRPLLASFASVLAQSEDDAARFRALGAGNVAVRGNLKNDAPPLPADENVVAALRRAVGGRPCWAAASTHEGEEAAVADALSTLRRSVPDMLAILAPRHPERGAAIADLLRSRGLATARRSTDAAIMRRKPRSTWSIRSASSVWSSASPTSPSWAARSRPMAGTIRWSRRGSTARSWPGRTRRTSRRPTPRWRMPMRSSGCTTRAPSRAPCAPCSTTRPRAPHAAPPRSVPRRRSAARSTRRSA